LRAASALVAIAAAALTAPIPATAAVAAPAAAPASVAAPAAARPAVAPAPAAATASAAMVQEPGVRREGDLVYFNLQQVDVRSALESISEVLGMSYVMGGNVPPNQLVTINTAGGIPIEQVPSLLDSVLRTYNLTLVRTGDVFTVMQATDAAQAQALGGTAATQVYVYYLRNADAVDVANVLTQLFGAGGPPGGFVSRTPERRPLSRALEDQQLDFEAAREPEVAVPDPAAISAVPAPQAIAGDLVGQTSIVPDETTNSLVVRTAAENIGPIEETIRKLDVRPLQVLIEVTVAEITLDESTQFGVDFLFTPNRIFDDDDARAEIELEDPTPIDGGLRVRILDAGDVDATLRALAADSRVNVLSTPRILSVNNNEARILVGSEVPFVQFQRSTIAESVDRVVQFRNVGLELTVTPRINPDRYVTLDLLQQVSSLSPDVLFDAPIITTREAETSLVVGDRQTVVLGGLIEDRKEKRKSGVPILKDIPILGWLFGSTETRNVKTELVITLTPYILGSDQELQAVRGEIEAGTEFYRDELQERIDDGRPVPGQLGPRRAPGEPAPQPVAPSPVLTPPAELPGGVPPAGVPPDTLKGRLEFDSAPAGEPFDEPRSVIGDTLPSWEP
jgi:type II secretory pathway component GspD/PulD (secretin)